MKSVASAATHTSGGRQVALWTVLAAQLMLTMDFLIVIVALPRIQQDLGFTQAGLSWIPNAFSLALGGLLLLGGRLGDMMGQVRAFRVGIGIFVIASLTGGLASTQIALVAARVFQGVGAALAGPSVLALVTVMARDEAERVRGLSLFIAVSTIGASAGLILGGVLTDFLSWRWSLLINVPVGIIVVIAVGRLVAETHLKPARLDVGGALTGTLGSISLVFGFINAADKGWGSLGTSAAFLSAIVLFASFFRIEATHKAPLLELKLLRNTARLAALAVMALIVGMHFSMLFMLVQFFQRVLGFGPLLAGLAYVPLTATVFAITHFVPRLIQQFGPRALLTAGCVLVAISLVLFAFLDESSRYLPSVVLPVLVHAAGVALVFAPGTVAIMHGVPDEHAGSASGLLQMDQQLGGALGIAIIASVYSIGAQPERFVPGLSVAFMVAAAIAMAAALVALRTSKRS